MNKYAREADFYRILIIFFKKNTALSNAKKITPPFRQVKVSLFSI